VLDVLLEREPFAAAAAEALSRAEAGQIEGCLCATTITTIHYLAAKVVGAKQALLAVRKLLGIFEIAPVNRPVLTAALDSTLGDFEDAVLHEAARQVSAQGIVTRDPSDFRNAALPTWSPAELCRLLDLPVVEST
jgi:predicted nucleic acid-binding protein